MYFKQSFCLDPARNFMRIAVILLLLSTLRSRYASGQEPWTFDCTGATAGDAQQKRQAAAELLNHSYDTSRLACGT